MPKRKVARHKGQQGCNSSTIDIDDQGPKPFSSKLRSPRWPALLGCCSAVANMTKLNSEQWRCGSAPARCRKRRAQRIRGTRHHAGGEGDEGSEGDGAFARLPANSATLMLLNCGLVANCLFERCRPS
jgi:hypothetical protein